MKYIKTYESLFNFFKKKSNTFGEDKIAETYINRLKKIKGLSPYIMKNEKDSVFMDNDSAEYNKYIIEFDDTPIKILKAYIIDNQFNRFSNIAKNRLTNEKGAVFKDEKTFYVLYLPYPVEEYVFCKWQLLEELYELAEKVYKEDKRLQKINKINLEINPSADLID